MSSKELDSDKGLSRRSFIQGVTGSVIGLSALNVLQARAQNAVKLGVVWPLGENPAGNEMKRGADYAANLVNSEKPFDYPERIPGWSGIPGLNGADLELVYKNHEFDPDKAAQAVKELKGEGAVGILGALNSQVTRRASEAAANAGLPMITSASLLSPLTKRGIDSYFRICSDNLQGAKSLFAALSNFVGDLPEDERQNVPSNYTYLTVEYEGVEGDLKTIKGFAEDGVEGEFEGRFSFDSLVVENGTEAGTIVDRVKSLGLGPDDGLVVVMSSELQLFLVQQLANEYPDPEERPGLIFADPHQSTLHGLVSNLSTEQMKGWRWTLSNIQFFPAVFAADANFSSEFIGPFRDDFEKNVNPPNPLNALAFTGIHTWASVLDKAGSTKSSNIVKAAKAIQLRDIITTNWNGIAFGETDYGDVNANINVIPGTAHPDAQGNLQVVELPGGFTPSSAYASVNIDTNPSCLINCVTIGVEANVSAINSVREKTVDNHARYTWNVSKTSKSTDTRISKDTTTNTQVSNSADLL